MVYALGVPHFIVDQYKRRIFSRLSKHASDKLPDFPPTAELHQAETLEYDELARVIEGLLPRDVTIYNDFHALLVRLGAVACGKRPVCPQCPIGPQGSGLCRGIPSGE
jgi:endonuclease-3 related protein